MDEWYYIGPDKTGLLCSDCCAGFSDKNGSCQPYSCPVAPSSFRPYICPNPSFPSPQHVYAWTNTSKSSVYIIANSYFCPNSSTTCWLINPSTGLNAGGRVGGVGCSSEPEYVSSTWQCSGQNYGCSCPDCYTTTGARYQYESCVAGAGGCSCVSESSVDTCDCLPAFQQYDSEASCYSEPIPCPPNCYNPCEEAVVSCSDGTKLYYCIEDSPPECPIPCSGPEPSCGGCYGALCDTETGEYSCRSCTPACTAGFSCSCGYCRCTSASTCCSGYYQGWSFKGSNASPQCSPCYSGWQSSSRTTDCCDEAWIRKNCNAGSICCNDGRCYESSKVMCDGTPPSTNY